MTGDIFENIQNVSRSRARLTVEFCLVTNENYIIDIRLQGPIEQVLLLYVISFLISKNYHQKSLTNVELILEKIGGGVSGGSGPTKSSGQQMTGDMTTLTTNNNLEKVSLEFRDVHVRDCACPA